ncbi:MAG: phosphoenolpyruvate synthase [Streptosporangiales bacterium]|nr:phosphoenolpyruvate synthase [Streptosporangiales bacterium]
MTEIHAHQVAGRDAGSDGPLVAGLAAFGRDDLELAGGKAANLGELVRQGFPVPGGFVVTTEAYALVVERAGLACAIADRLAAGEHDGAGIRAAFAAAAVPDEVREAVRAGYAELGGGPVAVRSSATAEDLPGAAFAGQQDTYLNVNGEDALLAAVADCWASLWTDRAIAYRERRGVDQHAVRIAVVVQAMVDADTAGVLFTANPVTGERGELVVDASTGLGEAVVSGLVTPDHYVLDRGGAVQEWTPGRAEVVIRTAADGGVTHDESASAEAQRLPDAVLRELAKLGVGVEAHFGRPQDTEWAVVGGQVYLLQARPMTALPPPPLRLNRVQRRAGTILLDYLPVRPYPLDVTTWMVHGPLGMMNRVFASLNIRMDLLSALYEEDGVVYRIVPPQPHPSPKTLAAPFLLLRRARRYDSAAWMRDPRYAEYLECKAELAGRDVRALPWRQLVGMVREALALVEYVTVLRIDYLPSAGVALLRLRLALMLFGFRGAMSDLLISPTTTSQTNDALDELAAQVRADSQLRQAFADLDTTELRDALRTDQRFADFQTALDAFLAEYGHRETVSPILASQPTWQDAPETVLDLVKVLVEQQAGDAPADRAEPALAELLARPLVRRLNLQRRVRRWVASACAGVACREDTHFHFTKPLPILRRTLFELGRRLTAAGVVREPFDVFHLELDELEVVEDEASLGGAAGERLRAAVVTRAAKRDELAGVRMIDPRAVYPDRGVVGTALVSGTPACGGRVTAPVRVVHGPADFGALRSGEVLVCPYTNPAWTPLFQRAAAVVVDAGGPASHAAIVAREYGLPAIMGTGVATSTLTDGQLVTVDGDRGQVLPADGEEA